MIRSHYTEVEAKIFDGGPAAGVTGRVAIGKADGSRSFCMRVFELAADGHTPRHEHEWEHEIFFHAGNGEVLHSDEWVPVSAGSVAFIPGGMEHQIRNTGPDPLVFVCLIPEGPPEL